MSTAEKGKNGQRLKRGPVKSEKRAEMVKTERKKGRKKVKWPKETQRGRKRIKGGKKGQKKRLKGAQNGARR